MNWNSLRGPVAEKIIEGLTACITIKEIHMNNNLIGVSYDNKQPPVNKMADLL